MFPNHTPPAPDALLEMVRYNCVTDTPCSRRHVAVQTHNCHVPSSANVMTELVLTAGQYRKTATTKKKTNSNCKMENYDLLKLHIN